MFQLVLFLFCKFHDFRFIWLFLQFPFPERGNVHEGTVEHLMAVLFPQEKYLHENPQHLAVHPDKMNITFGAARAFVICLFK